MSPPPPPTAHALTDIGLTRTNNEDAVHTDEQAGIYILCDGVGGHNAGEYASAKTIEIITQALAANDAKKLLEENRKSPGLKPRHELKSLLLKIVNEASKQINEESKKDPKKMGMATTLELLLVIGRHAFLAHVGDSRTYLTRKEETHPMTDDHTVGMDFVRSGQATLENAKKSPYWNVLTRAIGTHPQVKADVRDFELTTGDTITMASDGVSDVLDNKEISSTIKATEPKDATKKLIELAKSKKSKDNLSAIVIEIDEKTESVANVSVIKKIEAISKVSLFRYCSYPDLTMLMNRFEYQKLNPNDDICMEGTISDALYVILSGEIHVDKKGVGITDRKPGEVIGEMGVLEGLPRSASLRAKTNAELLKLSRDQLVSLLKEDQRLAVRLLWALCQEQSSRLRSTTESLMQNKGVIPAVTPPDFLGEITIP
ncbi:MAG: cyclic nucleotide-binding domain-containing protein [Xanthomonadaceae bacterium]|nr:cyclic nucleotide-binding domain-containing protein [Xanthomonadaceae bacterium]